MWQKLLNKKSLIYLGIVLLVGIFVAGTLFYYFPKPKIKETTPAIKEKPAQKSPEEMIKDLTAQATETEPIPEPIRKDLSAPSQKKNSEVSEEILKNLTAPK